MGIIVDCIGNYWIGIFGLSIFQKNTMNTQKTFKLIFSVILVLLLLMSILTYFFFDKIKKMYQELSSKNEMNTILLANHSVDIKTAPIEPPMTIIKYQTVLKDAVLEDAFGNPL